MRVRKPEVRPAGLDARVRAVTVERAEPESGDASPTSGSARTSATARQSIRRAAELIGARAPLDDSRDRAVGLCRPAALPQRRRRARDRARAPRALLDRLLEVERELGRVRDGPRCGPRTIDLDLLALRRRDARRAGARPSRIRGCTSGCSCSSRSPSSPPSSSCPGAASVSALLAELQSSRVSHLDELDDFEAELELRLKKEYGAVYSLFRYCVLTQDGPTSATSSTCSTCRSPRTRSSS